MGPFRWLLLAAGAGAIAAYLFWWYGSREEPVAGRAWVAALRGLILLLAWLVLLNPPFPVAGASDPAAGAVLLDASFSMTRPIDRSGATVWESAVDSLAADLPVWLFGGGVARRVDSDSLPGEPIYPESRLTPAVRAAAASGARRLLAYTDGRIADVTEALEEAGRLGVSIEFVELGIAGTELGISTISATPWAQVGDTVEVRVELVAAGADTDSVQVEVLDEGEGRLASGWLTTPAAGRFAPTRLTYPVGGPPGYRRYVVRIAGGDVDAELRDNQRVFYVQVGERPAGAVVVSLQPDWEPSFLIAKLDRVIEAPTTTYFWLADSLVSLDDYRAVETAAARRAARRAPLLVLHGYGASAPGWARQLARDARRLLVMAAGVEEFELPGWGTRVGSPAQGEWYVSPDLPASPLALDLGDYGPEDLPPLLRLRPVEGDRAWTPLVVQRMRRGEPVPAVVAGTVGARRWAVAAGEGYWRWAFREGAGRHLYRSLWTGLVGWLVSGRQEAETGPQPLSRVVERGEPLRWSVPPWADSLSVELLADDSTTVWSATARATESLSPVLPPGVYRYRTRAFGARDTRRSSEGPVEVEPFSRELLPATGAPLPESVGAVTAAPRQAGTKGLATLGWPYLVLIALFCVEWAARRLIGLR